MDYKKKYEEALERAKIEMSKDGMKYDVIAMHLAETIFPELKRPDDEKIRKALIFHFQGDGCLCNKAGNIPNTDILAWLEKQKPTDKVEPKFKVGDWIVDKSGLTQQVLDFRRGIYTCTYNSFTIDCESNYHLWTIQDTKEGDVLKEDSCIFILEKIKSQDTAIVHCCLFDDGDFNLSSKICFDVDSTYPATKEQHDTLLKAMTDAGYTFDFEKKELKKIEQKSMWSEVDEAIAVAIECFIQNSKEDFACNAVHKDDALKWFKSIKEKLNKGE